MATHDAGIVDNFRKRVVRLAEGKVVSDVGGGDYGASVGSVVPDTGMPVSYTHLRAHETVLDLVCRLLLEKKKRTKTNQGSSLRLLQCTSATLQK